MTTQPDLLQAETDRLRAELAELRQAHERLQQSERRYRQVVENAPISILFINSAGMLTETNSAAEQLFGLSFETFQQNTFPIFENPQLVENGTLPYMLQALAGETVIEQPNAYDASRDHPEGERGFGKGHYFPIWDEAGQVSEIVEIAPDFSDLLRAQQAFAQERAQLLGTIAQVANLLLKSPDYTAVLPDVVRLLGEAVGSDRCSIVTAQSYPLLSHSLIAVAAEWCCENVPRSTDSTPDLFSMNWQNFPELHECLLLEKSANYLVTDLSEPNRSLFVRQGVSSIVYLPIIVNGQPWGQIGFDNCGEPRLFEEAEIAILKVAADSIAAAIARQQKDEALQKSEALYRSLFEISKGVSRAWGSTSV
jgi:PAS domain S-box-containing protein